MLVKFLHLMQLDLQLGLPMFQDRLLLVSWLEVDRQIIFLNLVAEVLAYIPLNYLIMEQMLVLEQLIQIHHLRYHQLMTQFCD